MAQWKIAGVNFDHMHMGDNLRFAQEHPEAEIVGLCDEDPARCEDARKNLGLSADQVFADADECLEKTKPDLVVLCPATAGHADWVERVAPHSVHVMVEKPFAASLADADRMIAAMADTGRRLAINWPVTWIPAHRTTKRLLDEGTIGELREVHYYGGNRGPLWHLADKEETTEEFVREEKRKSWWYRRQEGGGSQLDYLGYGATLGTWYQGGRIPLDVTAVVDRPAGLEVDEHSITIARYEHGLSKMETRWGTFTDPWTHQTQPRCGFVLCGSEGTIASYDYETSVRIQTRKHPEGRAVEADTLPPHSSNPIAYLLHALQNDTPIQGPLSPEVSRTGQRIVDASVRSAREGRTVSL